MLFEEIFDRLLGHEGNYSNDPSDPGGETKWGISKRSHPRLIIKELTREDAFNIYKAELWNIIEADNLSSSIAFQVFDFAVNSGINVAIRYLQRAVGVADDGYWGLVSKAAISKISDCDIIMRLNAERLDFMTRLKNWPTSSRGWARRIAQNLNYGAIDTE